MIKYDWLEEKANNFIEALKKAEVVNESDFDAIGDIVEGLLYRIPTTICAKDYFMRKEIRNRLPKEKQDDTEFINRFMDYIYNQDAIYIGDYAIQNIDECCDEFINQKD